MSSHHDDMADLEREAERIAARRWDKPEPTQGLHVEVLMPGDEPEDAIRVVFDRDIDDTWAVHLGSNSMAVRNKAQARVITRMVELLIAQRQGIVFDRDGNERPDI